VNVIAGVDRSALIARNEAVWDALASAFAGAEARASEATRPGAWSAKDHLSHVVAWERHRLAVLRGDDFAAAMGLTPEVWAAADEDEVNALIAERTTGQSVATVLADVHTIRTAVGDAVREAPDERLATTYRTMHPRTTSAATVRSGSGRSASPKPTSAPTWDRSGPASRRRGASDRRP
jgi:hypothetical protein